MLPPSEKPLDVKKKKKRPLNLTGKKYDAFMRVGLRYSIFLEKYMNQTIKTTSCNE